MKSFLIVAVLSASPPSPQALPVPCAVTGEASQADASRALAACGTARQRFRELFGEAAPPLLVVLRPQPGYRVSDVGGQARVYWPTSAALAASVADPEAAEAVVAEQWREVLPHEAMHALVAAHFFGGEGQRAPYGTPLADWFEEGAAIWAEPRASRRMRMAQARNLPAELRALSAILNGEHPAARDPALLSARDGAALPGDNRQLRAFYPQSIAVLSFVFEAGGAAAVRGLAERMLAPPAGPLSLAGLPGLPADSASVDAAWQRWLPESGQAAAAGQRP